MTTSEPLACFPPSPHPPLHRAVCVVFYLSYIARVHRPFASQRRSTRTAYCCSRSRAILSPNSRFARPISNWDVQGQRALEGKRARSQYVPLPRRSEHVSNSTQTAIFIVDFAFPPFQRLLPLRDVSERHIHDPIRHHRRRRPPARRSSLAARSHPLC